MITIRCRCWLRAARPGACRAGAISACPKARRSRTCSSRCSTRSTCRSSRSPTARGSSRSDTESLRADMTLGAMSAGPMSQASFDVPQRAAMLAGWRRHTALVAHRPRPSLTALAAAAALSLALAAVPSAFAQPGTMPGGAVRAVPFAPTPDDVPASPLAEAARRGDVEEVLALVALGGLDIDAPSRDGTPALHWLLRLGEREAVRQVIAAGADVNKANRYGLKPLHVAIEAGDAALVRLLLEAGADPSAPDRASEPPLMLAARVGEPAVIEVLLEHGAEVDAREPHYGQTLLMIA